MTGHSDSLSKLTHAYKVNQFLSLIPLPKIGQIFHGNPASYLVFERWLSL